MTDAPDKGSNPASAPASIPDAGGMAAPVMKGSSRLSLIWLVPVVAALVAGWLVWTTMRDKGPTATIAFETAEGLEVGKTRLRYRDVDVGVVEKVEVSRDLSHVLVDVRMNRSASDFLRSATRFWVVKPRLGVGGVSGLGTLVSGSYIAVDPGEGDYQTEFEGLEDPPVVRASAAGTRFVLGAEKLGGLGPGSPITYRGIKVGEVLGYEFASDWRSLTLPVFVYAPYDKLVRDTTRFWNASGFEFSVGSGGPSLQMESIQSLLTGGIAFDTPDLDQDGTPVAEGTSFPLYASQKVAGDARFTRKIPLLVHFDGSVRGLNPGSSVEYRGIKIGEVKSVGFAVDPETSVVRIPVILELEPERMEVQGSRRKMTKENEERFLSVAVHRGMRAQLRTANILTGELLVAFDFFPDAPEAHLEMVDGIPEMPTQASTLDTATRTATDLMNELARAPIGDTVRELHKTIAAVGALVSSPEVQGAVSALTGALGSLEQTSKTIGTEAGPTVQALRQVAERAAALVQQAQKTLANTDGVISNARPAAADLQGLVRELTQAARSLRGLSDYLERNPDALIRGKR